MSVDMAALIFAIVGPLATAYFVYRQGTRSRRDLSGLRANDMAHLNARLDQIEVRLGRVETWMFEHQRNHSVE